MDRIQWRVTYRNGDVVNEYDESNVARGWFSLDIPNIRRIDLLSAPTGRVIWTLANPDGATPFFARRRQGVISGGQPTTTIVILGWAEPIPTYVFLWEDGRVLLTQDFHAV